MQSALPQPNGMQAVGEWLLDWAPIPGNTWLLPTILFFFALHFLFGSFLWSFVILAIVSAVSWFLLLFIVVFECAEYQRLWLHNPVIYGVFVSPAFGALAIFLAYYIVELFGFEYALQFGGASTGFLVVQLLLYACILLWPTPHFVALVILMTGPFYIMALSVINGAVVSYFYATWAGINTFAAAMFLTNFGWPSEVKRYPQEHLERYKDDYIFTVRGTYIFNASVTMSLLFLFFSFLWLIL